MLSRTTEYALRAVVSLAICRPEKATARTLARATGVPEGYMAKVLNTLTRAGIVTSRRGPSGGFALALEPDGLSMLRVVEAIEPLPRITRCPLSLLEHAGALCPLHATLSEIVAGVEARLAGTTIADLLSRPAKPLGLSQCTFPAPAAREEGG